MLPRKNQLFRRCLILLIAIPVGLEVFGLVAGTAIPSYLKARGLREKNECVYNMGKIETAKQEWTRDQGVAGGQTVDMAIINNYLKGSGAPLCPSRGTYTYNKVGEDPECSVHGSLSDPRVAGTDVGVTR